MIGMFLGALRHTSSRGRCLRMSRVQYFKHSLMGSGQTSSRPHTTSLQKVAEVSGNLRLFQDKSRLVKYYEPFGQMGTHTFPKVASKAERLKFLENLELASRFLEARRFRRWKSMAVSGVLGLHNFRY